MLDTEIKNIVYIYTTCSNQNEAAAMGLSAIKEKLAVSMDYWFVNSIYPWNNTIKETGQCMLMFLTQKVLSEKLVKHIESMHSYEAPVITRCDIPIMNQMGNYWANSVLSKKEEYLTESEVKTRKKIEEEISYKFN